MVYRVVLATLEQGWHAVLPERDGLGICAKRCIADTTAQRAGGRRQKNLFPEEELPLRIARLRSFMEQEKAYLNPDLTLTELAQQTGMNTAQLSFVINNGLGKNFNDFINQYRVEAVKSSLQDPSLAHLSLLGVAFECGFNSKTTFNRAFKKLTGNAPSGYLVRLAKDPQSCTN
ncbi:MAG: helix-turn-helix transcriptional regulator [Lewinellaceae bacterium]|nr:helix-turn-helix transcriptional regulator [Lewinellaceae bacterium]